MVFDNADGDRVVLKYYLFKMLSSQGFILPITVEYMLSQGLSFAQVGTVEALFMAGWVLWEIPTGYLGDRWGRRTSLFIGSGLVVLTLLGLSVSTTFPMFILMYSLWALSITFRSGSADAWLYDILEERLDESDFSHIKGRGRSLTLAVTAIGSIVGAYLASLNWAYPFVVNAALISGSAIIVLTFPETEQYQSDGDDDGETFTILDALPIVKDNFSQPPLRSFLLFTMLFFGLTEVVATFIQPVSTSVGVEVAQLGWLYAGLSLFAAGVSYYTGTIEELVGIKLWFYTAPLAVGVVLAVASVLPLAALPAFFLMRGVNTVSGSLRGQYINDRLGSLGRATALSSVSMVFALFAALVRVTGGAYASLTDPLTMLATFGGGYVLVSVALIVFTEPVSESTQSVSSTAD